MRPLARATCRDGSTLVQGHACKRCAGASAMVAGWGPRGLRQTKSVWHSPRNSPIARILLGAEKAPCPSGGLFRRLDEKRERRGGRRGILYTLPKASILSENRSMQHKGGYRPSIRVLCRGSPPRRS